MGNEKSFIFKIDEEDYEKLRKIAFDKNSSIAELVRIAIKNYLKLIEDELPPIK